MYPSCVASLRRLVAAPLVRLTGIVFTAAVLSGCMASAPTLESRAFADAARAVETAGDLILDELSIAERNNRRATFAADPANRYVFAVEDAPYQATIGEPPRTAAFRATLDLATQYANLLLALAEGQGVDEAKGHIYAMVDSVANIAGLAAIPGLPGVGGLSAVVRQLDPLLSQALQQASIAEARRLALEGGPIVVEVIAALAEATPAIFNSLVTELRREPGATAERDAKVAAYRTILSNFVVLLDGLEDTFTSLERAYGEQGNTTTLAALVKQTAMLEANVAAARNVFATLR